MCVNELTYMIVTHIAEFLSFKHLLAAVQVKNR